MTSTVTRLFTSREKALEAATSLRRRGFQDRHLELIGPGREAVADTLRRTGMTQARAEEAAARAGQGATVLVARPPFGAAAVALHALEPHEHVDVGAHRPTYEWEDNPSPLSDALHMKTLSHDPAPLSRLLGLATLSAKQNPNINLSHDPAPLSRSLGMRVLSAKQNPNINLSHNPAPLSKALGMRVLSEKQNPNINLSHDPAPLSHALGLPVLTREQ